MLVGGLCLWLLWIRSLDVVPWWYGCGHHRCLRSYYETRRYAAKACSGAAVCVGSLKVISFVAAAGWQLLRSWTLLESAPRKGGADVPRCLLIAEFDVFALLMIWRESLRTVIAGQPTAERQAYKIWSGARSPGFAK